MFCNQLRLSRPYASVSGVLANHEKDKLRTSLTECLQCA
jgi:hypothetical protein